MPMKPRTICIEPNCGEYAEAGGCRCPVHAAARERAYRMSPLRQERADLYATPRWQAIRRAVLEDRPFCAACLAMGKYTPAQVVDHITPHRGDRDLFFDPTNLQPLCKVCHDRKTATEDGGFGHRRGAPGMEPAGGGGGNRWDDEAVERLGGRDEKNSRIKFPVQAGARTGHARESFEMSEVDDTCRHHRNR